MIDRDLPDSRQHQFRIGDNDQPRTVETSPEYEWLQTNGLGGYACGTAIGPNTRRYHGLLIASMNPPVERYMLVNDTQETLRLGNTSHQLSATFYPGAVHPTGYQYLESFRAQPWPRWTYRIGDTVLVKELTCLQDHNTVILRWQLVEGNDPVDLDVRPMMSGRGYHSLQSHNQALDPHTFQSDAGLRWSPYDSVPVIHGDHNGQFVNNPDWYYQVEYPVEARRGLDHREDWWTPGKFQFTIGSSTDALVMFGTEPLDSSLKITARNAFKNQTSTKANDSTSVSNESTIKHFMDGTQDFLVRRDRNRTILAGYPWFTDWGRDTFISLEGILLTTGRFQEAKAVIESFAQHIDGGMIPNRFPDQGDEPEYNTIDASLWFVHATGQYIQQTDDQAFAEEVAFPAVRSILQGYTEGTRYGIQQSSDGLIRGGSPDTQLTWMDAEVHGEPVTPRDGKPVEIQALWIRALEVGGRLADRLGKNPLRNRYESTRQQAIETFRSRFWYDQGGYLYDVIDGHTGNDARLRPNQLYALSLCDDIVSNERARSILNRIQSELLTPYGLRTLSPQHEDYFGLYKGPPERRDRAYHQGTVWMFLLGPFLLSWFRINGPDSTIKAELPEVFAGLNDHLRQACLGTASEIFDGDEPHQPRGCFAQAWSVAEPLRVLSRIKQANN